MKQVVITIEDDEEIKWVDGVLTRIKKEQPKSIMDMVKSYEDACEVLGVSPLSEIALEENLLALSKLETIIKALNEGWVATEHMDDEWWYPWFYRFDKNNKDKYKDYVMARSSCVSHSDGGSGICDRCFRCAVHEFIILFASRFKIHGISQVLR